MMNGFMMMILDEMFAITFDIVPDAQREGSKEGERVESDEV